MNQIFFPNAQSFKTQSLLSPFIDHNQGYVRKRPDVKILDGCWFKDENVFPTGS